MKIRNKGSKIINIGTTILMPDASMDINEATLKLPAIQAFIAKGLLETDESDAAFQKAVEEAAARKLAEEAKAKAEAEAKAKADAAAAAEQEKNAAVEREKQIGFMLDTIKKTLPKKIDEATTWTDIEYKDKAIAYIYEADIDMAAMSAKEKTALQNSIKTEACGKAYQEMCPRLKPMFINDGINVRIRYLDKGKNELGICEFNHDTCR